MTKTFLATYARVGARPFKEALYGDAESERSDDNELAEV